MRLRMHHYTFRAVPGIVKRLTKIVGALVLVLTVATAVAVWIAGDDDFDYALPETTVNDVTRLNPTRVARVEAPRTVEELRRIVASSTGPISVGGGRYSQGGQISYTDSLHVDMRHLDDVVSLDVENRHITVQAGITWREIQEAIDAHDLAVKIMQTYANFTVGGSLSVNVHGRYIGEGPLVRSVESIGLVLANGELVHASREVNPQLFFGAIGGYGGLGIIVEAVLALESNTRIERRTRVLPVEDYARHFAAEIRDDPAVVFHNGDLYPPDYRTVRDVSWYETQKPVTVEERLIPVDGDYDLQPRVIDFVAGSDFGKWARQHIIDPMLYRSERVVWRNYEASYDVAELEPDDRTETTYALREYFVPVGRFDAFVARMRDIFTRHDVNVINVSIRHALPDPGTLLAWADEEVFAFVVYYQQGTSLEDAAAVAEWSRELIDAAVELGGTYYLPYQVLATPEQFRAAYPRHDGFFALKAKVDPQNRFRNRLWQRHYPANREPFEKERGSIADYPRREEQTLLTIPEWYLVFNPVEYTDFLQVGNDPSDFPFFASIDEYWSLYDRVTAVADAYGYDTNAEYLTMLWVIGISTTAEYLVKGSYETTVGRLTRWLADGEDTPEDRFIAEAQRAYSELLFEKPWYEFDFWARARGIWTETGFLGRHFLRKLERKLFFTAEFAIKALYAKLIGAAAGAYGAPAELIYVTAAAPAGWSPDPAFSVGRDGSAHLLAIPRWGPFTRAVLAIAGDGVDFVDISGNRHIAISLVGPKGRTAQFDGAEELFRSRVLSRDGAERVVLLVSVRQLGRLLRRLERSEFSLEHIYDY